MLCIDFISIKLETLLFSERIYAMIRRTKQMFLQAILNERDFIFIVSSKNQIISPFMKGEQASKFSS